MPALVQNGIPIFTDIDGDPLEDGYIYIGEAGLNPLSNPLQAYWDADLTVPAGNLPTARTKGGAASYNGAPSRLYVATNYSILVQDKKQRTVYSVLNSVDYYNSPSGDLVAQTDTLATMREIVPLDNGFTVKPKGHTIVGDVEMDSFIWNEGSLDDDDDYSVVRPTAIDGLDPGRFLKIATGYANVRQAGAKGDGTDDTDPFKAVFAYAKANYQEVIVPNTDIYYSVGDAILPASVNMTGLSRRRIYNPSVVTEMQGVCTIVFNTSYAHGLNFQGENTVTNINFWGDGLVNGLSQESLVRGLKFTRVSMLNYGRGFGSSNTVENSRFIDCHAQGNSNGFQNLVDSHVINCEINANVRGVNQQTGANDTTWQGNKVEFNTSENWIFFECDNNTVVNGVCDRAGSAGFKIQNSEVQICNVMTRRNGANILGNNECAHYFIEGSNTKALIINPSTKEGEDDGGGGDITPNYSFSLRGSAVGKLNIVGGDATGFVTSAYSAFNTPTSLSIKSVFGVDDATNVGFYRLGNGKQGLSIGRADVAGGASVTIPVSQPSISTFTGIARKIWLSSRRESDGSLRAAELHFSFSRSGGSAVSSYFSAMENQSTVGQFGNTSGNIQVTITNIASDASTFDLVITNTTGTQEKIEYVFN